MVHLGERDCPIQRRNQKVMKNAHHPLMTAGLRKKMGHAALSWPNLSGTKTQARSSSRRSGQAFYFIEMNTRIQVGGGFRMRFGEGTNPYRCR